MIGANTDRTKMEYISETKEKNSEMWKNKDSIEFPK